MSSVTPRIPNARLAIDVCSGAGVGAFQLAHSYPQATVLGLDINEKAIEVAKINTKHLFPNRPRSAPIDMIVSDGFLSVLDQVRGRVDVVSINPPFIAGDNRTYAAGGPTGMELIFRMIGEAKEALRMGGELYSHMAAPCAFDGTDRFRAALHALAGWEVVAYDVCIRMSFLMAIGLLLHRSWTWTSLETRWCLPRLILTSRDLPASVWS